MTVVIVVVVVVVVMVVAAVHADPSRDRRSCFSCRYVSFPKTMLGRNRNPVHLVSVFFLEQKLFRLTAAAVDCSVVAAAGVRCFHYQKIVQFFL